MTNEKKYAPIIIFLIILFGALAIGASIFYSNSKKYNGHEPVYIELPLIETYSNSGETKETKKIKANIALGGIEDNEENIDYYNIAKETIANIEYEDITSIDGLSIIRESIKNAVNEELKDNEKIKVEDVYIYGLDVGNSNIRGFTEEGDSKNREEQFKNWFGN